MTLEYILLVRVILKTGEDIEGCLIRIPDYPAGLVESFQTVEIGMTMASLKMEIGMDL